MGKVTESPRKVAIALVRLYQYAISPFLASCCRFEPSCSEYSVRALEQYGIFHGSWLAIKRLLKCHPLHPGGYDPLPEKYSTINKVRN
ncbi:MAG: membrane protein insertion efficiency factor YidD [Gammaproteobacteria bacterium]|nr:membrane protein insertion efficiency factor YidD [Gammaproteobacteria bacterium]